MRKIGTFFMFALLLLCSLHSQTVTLSGEAKADTDNAYGSVIKLTSAEVTAFFRYKKDADDEPEPLVYYPGKTTQDFALRSWGIRTPYLIIGAVQHRSFVSELRNPLFATDNAMPSPLSIDFGTENIIYTAATSLKFTEAAGKYYLGNFLLQSACSIDGSAWSSAQYQKKGTEQRFFTEVFAGTFSVPLPPAKKWKKLYPNFGNTDRSYYPAVKIGYAGSHLKTYAMSAWELRQNVQAEYLTKAKAELAFSHCRLFVGAYKSSLAMRDLTGTFPGRDKQLTASMQVGTKRFRCGVTGTAATKTENTLTGIDPLLWNVCFECSLIPPKTKLAFRAALSGTTDKNDMFISMSGTITRRALFAHRDVLTFLPRFQWKQDSNTAEIYRYLSQGELQYNAEVSKHFFAEVSCLAGSKETKKDPYSFVEPNISVSCTWNIDRTVITAKTGFTYETVFFDNGNRESSPFWFITVKITEKLKGQK